MRVHPEGVEKGKPHSGIRITYSTRVYDACVQALPRTSDSPKYDRMTDRRPKRTTLTINRAERNSDDARATSCPSPRRDAAVGVIPDDQSDARKACEDVVEVSLPRAICDARRHRRAPMYRLAPPSCESLKDCSRRQRARRHGVIYDNPKQRMFARCERRNSLKSRHRILSRPRAIAVFSRASRTTWYRGVGVAGGPDRSADSRASCLGIATNVRSVSLITRRGSTTTDRDAVVGHFVARAPPSFSLRRHHRQPPTLPFILDVRSLLPLDGRCSTLIIITFLLSRCAFKAYTGSLY